MVTVLDFQGNLCVGDLDKAYELTTEEFQCRQTLEEFADFVEKHDELTWDWSDTVGAAPSADGARSFRIRATAPDGTVSNFELRLQKEDDDKWKVDEVVFP